MRKGICNRGIVLIANNKPFSISKEEISSILGINIDKLDQIINSLVKINMIEAKQNCYRITFPVFLEKDLTILDKHLNNIGRAIGEAIISNKQKLYDKMSKLSSYNSFTRERLLYHIICDYIFDGTAFDYFDEKGLFCVSKPQIGDRDYIAVGYEDNEIVDAYSSNKLLCSSNNYRSESYVFNSFGDSNGQRRDMFRFIRLSQKALENTSKTQSLNFAYIKIIESKNQEIAEQCGNLLLKLLNSKIHLYELSEAEKELVAFLKELEYIDIDEKTEIILALVPIFNVQDVEIINEISTFILNTIHNTVKELFVEFEKNAKELTAIQHNVDIKEILNELWHQVFGATNEYLVKEKFVAQPMFRENEGRYLQSLTVLKSINA